MLCYTTGMKKSLFIFIMPLLLLPSCGKSVSDYQEDAKKLFAIQDSDLKQGSEGFASTIVMDQKDTSTYLYRFVVNQPSQNYSHVKLIVAPKDNSSYFMFGYDKISYTLSKQNDKAKGIVPGISLNFSLNTYQDTFKVFFESKESTQNYLVTLTA